MATSAPAPPPVPGPAPSPAPVIDIGRVVGTGFGALKANFLPFFGMSALLAGLPTFLIQYWTLSQIKAGDLSFIVSPSYWGGVAGGLVVSVVAGALLQGVLVRSTILHLSGRDADLGQSIAAGLRLLLPIVGTSILVGILVGIGFLFLIVPGVIVYCAFIVAIPALVEERRGVFGSMQRSRDLTRGSRGQVFLLLLLFFVLSVVISALARAITGVSFTNFNSPVVMPDPLLAGLGNGLAASLSSVIVAVLLAALYVELRTVKEGATTDDLAGIFE